jgi:2-polyprenyl-6-methoxyphenol hydroxylase-like FAD-dependent oxidoreductase
VTEELLRGTVPWQCWNETSAQGKSLRGPGSDLPSTWVDKYGWPAIGVSRTRIQLLLKEVVQRRGIVYEEGWRLKDLVSKDNSVVAHSDDGRTIEAHFAIGCDGLKSRAREVVLAGHGIESKDPTPSGLAVVSQSTKRKGAMPDVLIDRRCLPTPI